MRNVDDELSAIFAASWARLVRSAWMVTRDEQLAEDAVQLAFAKAYAYWRRVGAADDPTAYIRRIAINNAIAAERKRSRRTELMPEEMPVSTERTVGSIENEAILRSEMWSAVGLLPPRQRAIIALRYYEDLSERQIADILNCQPGTVKSQSAAALATLRRTLSARSKEDLR